MANPTFRPTLITTRPVWPHLTSDGVELTNLPRASTASNGTLDAYGWSGKGLPTKPTDEICT